MDAGILVANLVVSIVCMFICGNIFVKKGRSKTAGMVLGFLLSVIGVIIALVLPPKSAPAAMS